MPPEGVVARVKALAEGKIAEALNQKDKHTRIEAVERAKKDARRAAARRISRTTRRTSHTLLGDVEYNSLRSQVLDTGQRVDGREPTRGPRDLDRHRRCCRARTARRCSRAARRRRSSLPR